jgi:hypothetical protein
VNVHGNDTDNYNALVFYCQQNAKRAIFSLKNENMRLKQTSVEVRERGTHWWIAPDGCSSTNLADENPLSTWIVNAR